MDRSTQTIFPVRSTAEVVRIRVVKLEGKGNKRVRLVVEDR